MSCLRHLGKKFLNFETLLENKKERIMCLVVDFDPFSRVKASWQLLWKRFPLQVPCTNRGEQLTAHVCLLQPYLFPLQKTGHNLLQLWCWLCKLTRLLWTGTSFLVLAPHEFRISTKQNVLSAMQVWKCFKTWSDSDAVLLCRQSRQKIKARLSTNPILIRLWKK